jgi:thiamine monophosphate kinase
MLRDWQATAAMDTSDSLAQCALQLAAASGVGLRLDFRRYAFAPAVPAFARACRKLAGPLTGAAAFSVPAAYTPENSPQTYGGLAHFVLASAEDYALLFTAPPHQQASLAQAPCGLQQLGQVVPAADGCTYLDETGRELPLENFGWQHL